jgi:hypothetical protein
MGCSGSATSNAWPENFCGDGDVINMEADVPQACFFTTSIGSYCSGVGQSPFGYINGSTEWTLNGGGNPCGVCSSCNGLEQGPGNGLCGYGSGSCSWAGARQRCKRIAFNGDPLACCRRSKHIQGGALFCFDSNDKARTCEPQYRGFAQPSCTGVMATYCSDDTETSYKAKWVGTASTKDCLRYVQENAGNLPFYGPVITAMVSRYLLTDNNKITSVQTDGSQYDPFITTIVNVCRENAGACDAVLKQKCAGVTRTELSNNVNLASLCGCFMPDIQYESLSQFGIERDCDPVCVLGTAVHLHDTATSNPAEFLKCGQSICVIDDVTLNILAGSVVGDISFSQACSSCSDGGGSGSCRCYITDTTITAIDSLLGNVSFQQQCGNTPLCYRKAPVLGAPPIQVDCDTGDDIVGGSKTTSSKINPTRTLQIVLGVLIFLILIGVMAALSSRDTEISPPILIPGAPPIQSRPMIAASRGDRPRSMLKKKSTP